MTAQGDKRTIKILKENLKRTTDKLNQSNLHAINIQSKLDLAIDRLRNVSIGAWPNGAPESWTTEDKVQWGAADALVRIAKMDQARKPFV